MHDAEKFVEEVKKEPGLFKDKGVKTSGTLLQRFWREPSTRSMRKTN